uniref:T9SS type B sorting domain-containing protein n=1 Tax=Winogradskyella sp. TaxID=1883156 RepID=UPI0035131745
NGTLGLVGATVEYTPNQDYNGSDTFTYTATDSDSGVSTEATVSITVTAVNDPVTDIILSNLSVEENSSISTFISQLTIVDVDSGNYFISVDDDSNFEIDSNLDISSLLTSKSFDFESKSSYPIDITVDQDGLIFTKSFNVQVIDVNEMPTSLTLTNTSVDENISLGSLVSYINSTDEDTHIDFNTHVYSLADGQSGILYDNSKFKISGDQLVTNSEIDFETQSEYRIYIEAFDGINTLGKEFIISVNNLDEDSDGDGLPDSDEGDADDDNDGVSNKFEYNQFDINENPIEVYKGISPNGDGINDVFVIRNISKYPDNEVIIMNRLGQTVYKATGYGISGKFFNGISQSGKELPADVYFYQVKVGVGNGQYIVNKGFLHINR